MAARPGRNDAAYKNTVANMRAERRQPCHACGQRIDYDAAANTPDAFEADHLIPLSDPRVKANPQLAADPANLAPSHHRCNRSRGNKALPEGQWHRTSL